MDHEIIERELIGTLERCGFNVHRSTLHLITLDGVFGTLKRGISIQFEAETTTNKKAE